MTAAKLDLPNSTWLVTGCSTGFGRALAHVLIDKGARVVVTARRPESLAELVAQGGERVIALPLDVTDAGQIAAAFAAAEARFGALDVLVNNAGYGAVGTAEETPIEVARALMETNYFGTVAMCQAVITTMRTRGAGRIVNVGSVAGQIGFPAIPYYAASKFALAGYTEALAAELRAFGVRVTLAELGPFATSFNGAMTIQPPGPAYDMAALTVEAGNAAWGAGHDPVAGAEALVSAVCSGEPPVRLLLGEEALKVVALHDGRRAAARAKWHSVSMLEPDGGTQA